MCYYPKMKNLRDEKENAQKEIAGLLGTSQKQYSRWETGVREIPSQHIVTLCKFYNVSADYLLGLIDEPKKLEKNK